MYIARPGHCTLRVRTCRAQLSSLTTRSNCWCSNIARFECTWKLSSWVRARRVTRLFRARSTAGNIYNTNTLYSKPVVALTVAHSTAGNIYKHKHFIQQTSSGINCGTQYSREYLQHTNTLYSKPVVALTVARSTAGNIYNTQTLYTANQ